MTRLSTNLIAASLVLGLALAPGRAPANGTHADCPADPATAPPAVPQHVDPGLLRALLDWIGAHSPYDVAPLIADPPTVDFCRTGKTISYEGREVIVRPDLRAAYDLDARQIYLVRPWSADDPRDRATLLHELVHAAQFRATTWDCLQRSETEAYRLQALWLEEQGITVDWDWFAIYLAARCPIDVHP